MEKRVLLAIVLSAAILILYQMFFMPSSQETIKKDIKSETEVKKADSVEGKKAIDSMVKPELQPVKPASPQKETPVKRIEIENSLTKFTLSSRGGRILSVKLKNYKDKKKNEIEMVPGGEKNRYYPMDMFMVDEHGNAKYLEAIYDVDKENIKLNEKKKEETINFTYTDPYGLRIIKSYKFLENEYRVSVSIKYQNLNQSPQIVGTRIVWSPSLPQEDKENGTGTNPSISSLINGKVARVEIEKISGIQKNEGQVQWTAVENEYFAAAILPEGNGNIAITEKNDSGVVSIGLQHKPIRLNHNEEIIRNLTLYAGPKEYSKLKTLNRGLEEIINFGWFWWLCIPLLQAMNFFYYYVKNYGIVIIIITVIIKILFYPLTQKSYNSMKEMQALQPQINALRAKLKNDSQRLNKEIMELYKKHGVNPMSGCLPMVIQIPVFIALYNTLVVAIELRHAPFMLWIRDLSAKDPYYVLPILMGVSMLIQQKMTPTTGDPRQAKIMLIMPIIFTFMFLNFPTGLVLYWLVNNVLSIAQQLYVEKRGKSPRVKKEAAKS